MIAWFECHKEVPKCFVRCIVWCRGHGDIERSMCTWRWRLWFCSLLKSYSMLRLLFPVLMKKSWRVYC